MFTMLTAIGAITEMTDPARRIGEIVSFHSSASRLDHGGTRLIARRPGEYGCVLDTATLRSSGGSFVIEGQAMEGARRFRVHWAGERTSADSGDCGRTADLILDSTDVSILANAANETLAPSHPLSAATREFSEIMPLGR